MPEFGLDALGTDDRSVSEVLGYILIFALVISSVAFVSLFGTPALEGVQENEMASNAERALDVAAANFAAVYERNAPSRATEIDLGGSSMYYDDPVTITVDIDGDEHTTELRPVVLRVSDRTSLVYEGGAIFRVEGDGGTIRREPPMLLSDDRVQVPLVNTTTPANESVSGTTILLRGVSQDRSVLATETDETVEITVESPRYELWKRYFEGKSAVEDCDTPGDETVTCVITNPDPDLIYVTEQEIEVSFIL